MKNNQGRIYVPENAGQIEIVRTNEQLYKRRDFLKKGAKVAAGVGLGGLTLELVGCAMPLQLREQGMTREQFEKDPIGNAVFNYGAIDDYVKVLLEEGDIGTAAQGVLLYPADFVLDLGRSVGMAVVDIPKEAWERAESKAAKNVKSEGDSSITDIIYAPIKLAGNATNFTWEYLALSVDGTIKHIAKHPLEGMAHGFSGWYVGRLIYDANKGGQAKPAEVQPPKPPFPRP